jgi:ABC-type multidrug transport system fused ATPase/permease subunit
MNENSRISSVIVSIFCIGIIIFILFTQMEISTIKLKLKDASLMLIFLALLVYINGYEKLFLVLLLVFVIFYFTPSEYVKRIMSYFTQKKSILKKVRVVEDKELEQEPEEYEQNDEEEYQDEYQDETDNESQANTEITIDDDIENEDIQINKISQNNNND